MTVHVTNIGEATSARAASRNSFFSPSRPARSGLYRRGGKRLFETLLVLLSAPFVLPFCLLIAGLIRLEGGPAFYRQERVGRDGRRFQMWKFRTMVVDAESRLSAHLSGNPHARIEWARSQKLKDDPRCTRLGRILRRSSIDELPQLLNVLTGDMSLVGPRPMMPSQQSLYPGASYYRLRPGITGYWQVSARNESEFRDRAEYDDLYDETISLATDAMLLGRTGTAVLRGTGY